MTAGMDLKSPRLCYIFMIVISGAVHGLQITSTGPTSIEMASGGSVKLDCQFSLATQDAGPLDIEWSLQPSDNQREEKVIILYSGDRAYDDYYPALKGRVHFNSSDPKKGDASINLLTLQASDTGTYQCKVKKAPGIGSRKVLLTVMVRPSTPKCSTEGSTYIGDNVVLKCKSSDGTSPLQYIWDRISGNKLLPATAVTDPASGTISMRNASEAISGTYRCTAKNRVGTDECVLQLKVIQQPNTAGIIAGSVIGVLLLLLLIALILFCCCRARHRKKYEKEISYEIREDVPPPKSRISTARSFASAGSQRSSLGSMSPSNLHEYSKAQYDKVPSEEYDQPPSHAPLPPPSRMAGPNLSRMGAVPVMVPAQNRDGSIV
ncbi:coxsackievirus and adenovirus receptor homolog [Electrophorus electricus]|uniref:Ig-like domain-containing protein n=1 Tax=Electrophorus electricus TaxID=8005 RepID=A0A4W4FAW6_ELEEL|nr:coxsackievirus and adenovirus receptor homolog [Electrophorus electricus]